MKKTTLIFALFFFSLSVIAQDENLSYRPIQGSKAISFNVAGLANLALNSTNEPLTNSQMIDVRYFIKDDLALRFGLGVNRISTTLSTQNDTAGGVPLSVSETDMKRTSFSIGASIEKHVKTKSRTVDPFVGAGLFLSILGDSIMDSDAKTTQLNGDYTQVVTNLVTPGGSAFGIAINGGFFWYFAQNLALGAEITLGFASGGIGGESEETMTTTTKFGSTTTTTETHSTMTNDLSFSGIQTLNTGAIHLLVKF